MASAVIEAAAKLFLEILRDLIPRSTKINVEKVLKCKIIIGTMNFF